MRIAPRSLRRRLFVLFTSGSAVILIGAGIFLFVVIDRSLLEETNAGLHARADDLVAVMRNTNGEIPDQDVFAQVFAPDGTVIDASPASARDVPTLDPGELANVGNGGFFRRDLPQLGGESQLWAQSVDVSGRRLVLVVGAPLDQYARTRRRLVPVLLIGGPLIVLSIAGAGWLLAGAALRPVRRMAAEADTIAITDLSRRIAAPDGDDEIAALAHTLNDMLDRIETSVEHERRFIDDASHELRTPLSILRGELELALAAPDADDLVDSLTSALEETDRLSRLSGDLLALARARAELRAAKVEAVDLRQVAERIGTLLSDDEGPAVRCVGDSVVLRGERDRVDRILLNTIANARRYASARVEVRIERDGDGVALVVADDGPGFPTSMLPVAFERFRRGDPTRARDTGGTGLGLAIVAELVRTMGGRITAGNGDVLGGAWVRAWFPLDDGSGRA